MSLYVAHISGNYKRTQHRLGARVDPDNAPPSMARSAERPHSLFCVLLCCFWLAPLLAIVALLLSWRRMLTIAEPAADFQLRLTRNASRAWVIGDWDGWTRPGVPMHRDGSGLLAAEIWLPTSCTRSKLAVPGVCCYRFKFLAVQGASSPKRWLIDESQPTDTDGSGNVNNVLCKHTAQLGGNISQRNPLQRPRMSSASPGSARKARPGAGGASMANPARGTCLLLTGTAFNGTTLGHANARNVWTCCEACQHRRRCTAFNWRPEPLAKNCVLLGPWHGEAVGNALSYAGLMQPPKAGATGAIAGGQNDAATGAHVQMTPKKTPKKRGKRRFKKRAKPERD